MKNVSEILYEIQEQIHELGAAEKEKADKATEEVLGSGAQGITDRIVQLEKLARINGRIEAYQMASLTITRARNKHVAELGDFTGEPEA